MSKLRVLLVMMILVMGFGESWGAIYVNTPGNPVSSRVSYLSVGLAVASSNPGDSILFEFNSNGYPIGDYDEIKTQGRIFYGLEDDPDNFPYIYTTKNTTRFNTTGSDTTKFIRIIFKRESNSHQNAYIDNAGGRVIIDKCVFYGFQSGDQPLISHHDGYYTMVRNSIFLDCANTIFGFQTYFHSGQEFYVVNNTFLKIATVFHIDNYNGSDAFIISNNIFHTVTTYSSLDQPKTAAMSNDFYSCDYDGSDHSSNITENPLFKGNILLQPHPCDSIRMLQLQQISPCVDAVMYSNESYVPDDDIGGNTRKAVISGDGKLDMGAWEYQDRDAPIFKKITTFNLDYDNATRPGFQDGKLNFKIEIAPDDWDTIDVRVLSYNSYVDNDAMYPADSSKGISIFKIDSASIAGDQINYKITNNNDTSWTIETLNPIEIPKTTLDDLWSDGNIFGKWYYGTMLLSDDKGNWGKSSNTDDAGNKPLDTMQVMNIKSLYKVPANDTIKVDAGQSFNIETWIELTDGVRPTDYNDSLNVTIWDEFDAQVDFNWKNGSAVNNFNIPFTGGRETNDELINFANYGSYKIVLKVNDNIGFTDTIYLEQYQPAQIQFLDMSDADLEEISFTDGVGALRQIKLKLTRNSETTDPLKVKVSYSSTNEGKFGTTTNPTASYIDLVYTGSDTVKTFYTRLPLNTNSQIWAEVVTPIKPYIKDSINVIDGEDMILKWKNSNNGDNEILAPIELYSKMLFEYAFAELTTNGGTKVPNANLTFSQDAGSASFSPNSGSTNSSGVLLTDITFGLDVTSTAKVSDTYSSGLEATFDFDAEPAKVTYVNQGGANGYNVEAGHAGTNADPDVMTTFSSLTVNLTANLKANTDNDIDDEDLRFQVKSGTVSFTGTGTEITSGGGLATAQLTFTPGTQVKIRVYATGKTNVERYIVINAQNEAISFDAGDSIAFDTPSQVKKLIATYTIDGYAINGVSATYLVIDDGTNNLEGTFDTNPFITTNGGKASPNFTYPNNNDYNKVKVSAGSVSDTITTYFKPNIADDVKLLKSDGSTDPVSFTAGSQATLLMKITAGGLGIEGKLTKVTIDDPTGHPNFEYSLDGTTWLTPGGDIDVAIDATGELTFYVKDTKAGDVLVTVTEGESGLTASKTVTITAGSIDPNRSSFIADPTEVFVYNAGKSPDNSTLTLTLVDQYDNPIVGQAVGMPTDDATKLGITQSASTTPASGIITYNVIDSTAELVTFTQKIGAVTITDKPTVLFKAGEAVKSKSTVNFISMPSVADGLDSGHVTVTLKDKYGNLISGETPSTITINAQKYSSPKLTNISTGGVSNSSGQLFYTITDTIAQWDTVSVSFTDGVYSPKPIGEFTVGPLHHIVIEDKGDGTGVEVGNKTIYVGDSLTVYAIGYDKKGNYIGPVTLDNTWKWNGAEPLWNIITPLINSSYTILIPKKVGTGTIKVTRDGVIPDSTGVITILGGEPSYVTVKTKHGQLEKAGVSFGVKLSLYDKFDNLSSFSGGQKFTFSYDTVGTPKNWTVPTLDNSPTFLFSNGVGQSFDGNFKLYSADINYYLLATANTIETDTTGNQIDVVAGTYAKLKILDNASGNTSETDSATIDFKSTLEMHSSAFDAYDNYIGDIATQWSLGEGKLKTEYTFYSQFGDKSVRFRFNPHDSSTYQGFDLGKIQATDTANTLISDMTGNIKVISIPDHINITGNTIGSYDSIYHDSTVYITAGDSMFFYSASYDTNKVFISNFTSSWGETFASFPDYTLNSTVVKFNPTVVDTGVIIAKALSASMNDRNDTTGTIIVLPANPHYIYVSVLDPDKIVNAGDTVPVQMILKDKFGNIVNDKKGDLDIATLNFNIGPDNTSPAPHNKKPAFGPGTYSFKKGIDTTWVIYARKSNYGEKFGLKVSSINLEAGNVDSVTVLAGEIHHIKILYGNNPVIDTIEAGNLTLSIDDSIYLYSLGYDKMGNYIGDIKSNWSSEGFTKQFSQSGKSQLKLGTFDGLTDKGDVFANPVDTTIIADSAYNFKVTAGKLYAYTVHVYEADGLPRENMGDTVAIKQPFSITIDMVDRIGNVITTAPIDSATLNFAWLGANGIPAGNNNGKFEFINGNTKINRLSKPWTIDHGGMDSLNVVNMEEQTIRGKGIFMAIDRSGPTFSSNSPYVYDNNGDGFIDSVIVEFSEEINTAKISNKLASMFTISKDTTVSDTLTKYMKIDSVSVIDSLNIVLHTSYNFSTLKEKPMPKTDIKPIFAYFPNAADPSTGIFDIYNNPMETSSKQSSERVGLVLTKAILDDKCDKSSLNDVLTLTLSEYISADSLIGKLPTNGIKVLRKDVYGDIDSTLKISTKAVYATTTGLTKSVEVSIKGGFDFRPGSDIVKLLVGGGFRDTVSFINNDVNVDNYPINVVYSSGTCENSFKNFPNPIYVNRSGSGGSSKNVTPGGIFTISTDRPLEIRADMYTIQGNFVNSIHIKVTEDMLKDAGQEDGSRVNLYFGAEGTDGYLKVIDPDEVIDGADGVDEKDRWNLPTNKKGRILEFGVYVQKIYINNKYVKDNTLIIK